MLFRNVLIVASLLVFAFAVLATSIFRTSTPQYVFSQAGSIKGEATVAALPAKAKVEYYLVYPGMLPDHPLWFLKALRDKLWLLVTRDKMRRAELMLLFADKRVGMARELVKGGKAELGVPTAEKAEHYLAQAFEEQEMASRDNTDTTSFLLTLATSSLKHIEEIEAMQPFAPEDARPMLNKISDFPRNVYEKVYQQLNQKGVETPTVNDKEDVLD